MAGHANHPGGFGIDNFTVDEAAGTATCPAAVTRPDRPVGHFRRRLPRLPTAGPSAPPTRRGPGLAGPLHHRKGRPERLTPMVERTIAWLTAHGNRKLRYGGIEKNNAWLHHRTAALNLPRLLTSLSNAATEHGQLPDSLNGRDTPPHN